jgi:tRNA(Ile)-lysidine synthase
MADARRAVREQLESLGLPAGSLVLVACSGGGDSIALAAATAFEAPRMGFTAGAVIVDHQLQDGSAEVAAKAKQTCEELGLSPVIIEKVEVELSGNGMEAAARDAEIARNAAEAAAEAAGGQPHEVPHISQQVGDAGRCRDAGSTG